MKYNIHIVDGYGSFSGAPGSITRNSFFVPDVADYYQEMTASQTYRFLQGINTSVVLTLKQVKAALDEGSTAILICRESQDPGSTAHTWLMRDEALKFSPNNPEQMQ